MTYNIQFCYDEVSTIVPDRTAARIIAENPDFCCVNEVRDSEAHPEATMLAKVTGMHKTFGGNTSGSNGNLILSIERPISSETVFLKMAPSPVGWGDRYCVIAEFNDFCVAAVHLDTTNQGPSADVQASNAVAIATIRDAFAKYTKQLPDCFARFAHITRKVRRQRRVPLACRRMGAKGPCLHDAYFLNMTI